MDVHKELDRLFAAMEGGTPIHEYMRADERAAGRRVVIPGEVAWLAAADWNPTVVVSVDRKVVRLVAILALNPGTGALRRTVAAIIDAGLTPCIVAPTREMRQTMKRWKWKCRHVGYGSQSEEQWKPRRLTMAGRRGRIA